MVLPIKGVSAGIGRFAGAKPPPRASIQNICPISFAHNNLRCLTGP